MASCPAVSLPYPAPAVSLPDLPLPRPFRVPALTLPGQFLPCFYFVTKDGTTYFELEVHLYLYLTSWGDPLTKVAIKPRVVQVK